MPSDLIQFGFGAALIGVFFIPAVLKLYSDIKAQSKDHAAELKSLYQQLEAEKDARRKDAEDFFNISKTQTDTNIERTDALLVFFNKLMEGKKHEQ